jgi:hypothetical protein
MPCFGPGEIYSGLWHAFLPIPWIATEESVFVFLLLTLQKLTCVNQLSDKLAMKVAVGWY